MEREVRAGSVRLCRRLSAGAFTALLVAGLLVTPSLARADSLPDGRGYELVTPGLNGKRVAPGDPFFTQVTSSGDALAFVGTDAQDSSPSSGVYNANVSTRGAGGWSVTPIAIPFTSPETRFLATDVQAFSRDLSKYIVTTDQQLTPNAQAGENMFLGTTAGAFTLLTPVAAGSKVSPPVPAGVSADLSHIFFNPTVNQMPGSDKVNYNQGANLYEWTGGQLSIVNWLPGATKPSSEPAVLAGGSTNNLLAFSADGNAVLFQEQNPTGIDPLYLRLDGSSTVQVDQSQKKPKPDPNPQQNSTAVGVTTDGSQVLFTSSSELTSNANTGESGGSPDDAGTDLYDYDVKTGQLTDLTPDAHAADKATGADVQAVIGAADDASYVYFVATGDLAAGATAGQPNLYVEHDGTTTFIAPASGLVQGAAYTTPSGQNIAFESTVSLTGYDNTDQVTGQPDAEVYEYDAPSGTLVCASCRPDGSPPTAPATLPALPAGSYDGIDVPPTVVSDDGSRVFFESSDQVIPAAANGLQNVYEYENGSVSLISPGDGTSPATFVAATPSGDDVFFDSYDDVVPGLNSSLQSAIWDARVGGGFPITSTTEGVCTSTAQCRPPGTSATGTPRIATNGPLGRLRHGKRVAFTVEHRSLRGATVVLRVRVGSAGRLVVSGRGVRTAHRVIRHASTVTLRVRLTKKAHAALDRHHRLRLTIHVRYVRPGARSRTITVHLATKRKGAR